MLVGVTALVAEGRDGIGDGNGLADARGLDDNVVKLSGVSEVAKLEAEVI